MKIFDLEIGQHLLRARDQVILNRIDLDFGA